MICTKCGTENIDQALFCVGCGNPLKKPEVAPVPPVPKKKNRLPLFLCIAGAAVVIMLIVGIFLLRSGRAYETTAENFVIALFRDDWDMMEKTTEPLLYTFLRDQREESTAPVDSCEAKAISTEICDGQRLAELHQLYQLLGGRCELNNVRTVEVEYTVVYAGYQSTDVADVTLSQIDGCWYVVDVE